MIGLDEVFTASYRVTRDTLRVLARCLSPENARDYCLKCEVPPFFPTESFSQTLLDLEKSLDEPGVESAETLAKAVAALETVIDVIATSEGAAELGKQAALRIVLPAAVYAASLQGGGWHTVYMIALILVLLDQRLQEAYPSTLAQERILQFLSDAVRDGLTRPVEDPEEGEEAEHEIQPDILSAVVASAIPLGTFLLAQVGRGPQTVKPFFDYGFDHPPIQGLDETLDSAQHAFAAFLGVDNADLKQEDYADFEPEGPPFRKRPAAMSLAPVVRSPETTPVGERHGGGVYFQLDGHHSFSSGSDRAKLSVTIEGGGGALIHFSRPLDDAVLGSLSAIIDFSAEDPSAATWNSSTETVRGAGVRARRVAARLEAGVSDGVGVPAEFDVKGFVRVEQAEIVVGKLPLIGMLIPSGFRMAFDAGIVGSLRRRELHFEGGLATELVIPLNWELPLITVHTITVQAMVQVAQGSTASPAPDEASRGYLSLRLTGALSLRLLKVMTARVDGLGVQAVMRSTPDLDGNLGAFAATEWNPVLPNGLGLTVDFRGVRGSGFATYDPATERLSAALSLDFGGRFTLKGIGLCEPSKSARGHSWIIVASLELPRSGGFLTVDGVGLLFGSNRRSDPEAFLANLGAGNLDALVLPGDPVPKLATYSAALNALFPPSDDGEVMGVIFKLGVFSGKVKLALGLILDNGGSNAALKLYVIATIVATFPSEDFPALRIEAAGVGIWDASNEEFNLRVVLRNSSLFGGELTGEAMAFVGDPDLEGPLGRTCLLSFGGFNPRYQVPSARIYVPKPIQLSFAKGDTIKIEWRLYLAATPGVIHFGVSVQLQARFAGFGIRGRLALDVLIGFLALRFIADLTFSIELQLGSRTLAGLAFKGTLTGLFPAELSGKVSVKFLFWTWTSPRISIVLTAAEPDEETIDLVPRLVAAVLDVSNWNNGAMPGLLPRRADRSTLWLSPSAPLTFRQSVVPLERTITRCGTASLPGPTVFTIEPVRPAAAGWASHSASGEFAPGIYVELAEEESLSASSFVSMPAGFTIERPFESGNAMELTSDFEEIVLDNANPPTTQRRSKNPGRAVFDALDECAPALAERSRRYFGRPVLMREDSFAVVDPGLSPAATRIDFLQALTLVRGGGAHLVPEAETV